MSMQDPIADMFTRIRNGQMAGHKFVSMPHSNVKAAIAQVLMDEGFIGPFEKVINEDNKPQLKVELRYTANGPVIDTIKRVSRPGLRRYVSREDLPRVFGGYGLAIVSTSKGFMSAKQARANNMGGEVIGEVW